VSRCLFWIGLLLSQYAVEQFWLRNNHAAYIILILSWDLSVYSNRLVEETLIPLDQNRRAFRLVGGILVERTVAEVLPSVTTNRENLDQMVETLSARLEERQKEVSELKAKYNLQTPEELEALRRRRQQMTAGAH